MTDQARCGKCGEPWTERHANVTCGGAGPMTDHAANLRSWAQNEEMVDSGYTQHGRECLAAADEIERLRAALDANSRMFTLYGALERAARGVTSYKLPTPRMNRLRSALADIMDASVGSKEPTP